MSIQASPRLRVIMVVLAVAVLIGACAPISRWQFAEPGGPVAPFGSSSVRGEPGLSTPVALAPTNTPQPTPVPSPTPVPTLVPLSQQAAMACLAAGDVLYGIALQNSNVRQSPDTAACRIGRIPKGTLVRITGSVSSSLPQAEGTTSESATSAPARVGVAAAAGHAQPPAVLSSAAPALRQAPPAPGVGYAEDVLPIFQRTCNSCHSGIVKNLGLQVTTHAALMAGSTNGAVVVPGDSGNSKLWQVIESGKMPLIGSLTDAEKETVKRWIDMGALETRPSLPEPTVLADDEPAEETAVTSPPSAGTGVDLWLEVAEEDYDSVPDVCAEPGRKAQRVVSSELILPVACGSTPNAASLESLRVELALPGTAPVVPRPLTQVAPAETASATEPVTATAAVQASSPLTDAAPAAALAPTVPAFVPSTGAATGISAPAWGLPPPSDADGWLTPRGGLCVQRMLPDNTRGITALAFAPDGRLFIAFDSNITGETDPLILYDAFHPSRSVSIIDTASMQGLTEIMSESTRITGLDWDGGALYVSRAGEVGRIPDAGSYESLAGGFAVTSRLFHANNGIVVNNGWIYVSAGGVVDGYSDGPIVGIGEDAAQQVVSGGNPYAARIVRAPVDALLGQRSISAFSTAARGVRNPYGIAADPSGQIWFTDNGATNVPENVSAGDEVNVLSPAAIGGSEDASPYFGFPLALTQPADWYSRPALVLPNTAAPTGIAWALGTVYFAQYGKDPGLYRVGVGSGGSLVAERVLLGWPILAVTTAPDGALWIGLGDGGLFRLTDGC